MLTNLKRAPDPIRSIEPYMRTLHALGLYPVNNFRRATPGARIHAACAVAPAEV